MINSQDYPVPVANGQTVQAATSHRLIEAFLSGRNPRTLRAYSQDLADLARFAGCATVEDAARLLLGRGHGEANALALAYRASLVERGLAPATINRRLAAVRALVKLARTLGMVAWTLEVPGLRSENYRDTRGPGNAAIREVLDALAKRSDVKAKRDRAILRLLYDLALRRSEVTRLDVEDCDLEAGTLAVVGKGRAAKVKLTLPSETAEALVHWIAARGTETGALFPNLDRAGKGKRLTGAGLWYMVKSYGLGRPHGLRHAAITEALDLMNGNLRAVQRYSRHRDARILGVYDDNRTDLAGEVARRVAAGK